jgi:hypothetical protein
VKATPVYAKALSTDYWRGTACDGEEIAHPSLEDIKAAITRLDGKYRTIVTIKGDEDAHLAVGGGASGEYVVYATFDNKRFLTLTSAEPSDSKTMLFVGGQEGDYPKNIIVDLPLALAAAKAFAETGQIDPGLR